MRADFYQRVYEAVESAMTDVLISLQEEMELRRLTRRLWNRKLTIDKPLAEW